MSKSEKHIHNLDKISLLKITGVQQNYRGHAGDKAILLRACDCGLDSAFEMGDTKEMGLKYKSITGEE